jgi:hypothetical protein
MTSIKLPNEGPTVRESTDEKGRMACLQSLYDSVKNAQMLKVFDVKLMAQEVRLMPS